MIDKILYPDEEEGRERVYWQKVLESFRAEGLKVSNSGWIYKKNSRWFGQAELEQIAIGNYWLNIFDNADLKLLKRIAEKSKFKFTLSIDGDVKRGNSE